LDKESTAILGSIVPKKLRKNRAQEGIERTSQEIINNPPDKDTNHNAIGFITPLQAQFGLPHKEVPGNEWERINGNLKLRIVSGSGAGIPTGSIPRFGLAWVSSWQTKHPKETVIPLGNVTTWVREVVGSGATGGQHGTITRQKLELLKLFTSAISVMRIDPKGRGLSFETTGMLARKLELWDSRQPEQGALFPSYIILNTDFREMLLEHPIPIDMRALPALRRSPLAIDYYQWLAYRMSYLGESTLVTWNQLHAQLGSSYDWNTKQGRYKFRRESIRQLRERVLKIYPQARVQVKPDGLLLNPSPTPVPMTAKKLFLPK
jgi:hypothetical protein